MEVIIYGVLTDFRNKDLSCTSDEEEENLQDVMASYDQKARKYVQSSESTFH